MACGHQIQRPLASLSNAGSHAGFHTLSAHCLRSGFHHHVSGWTHSRTVDEQFSCGPFEQAVSFLSKQRLHRVIVRHHREDHVGQGCHRGQSRGSLAPEFLGQRTGLLSAKVIDSAHMESRLLQPSGHIGPHASHSHTGDSIAHSKLIPKGFATLSQRSD